VNVNVTNPPATQTVSGTVKAEQSGAWSVEVAPLTPITDGGQASTVLAGFDADYGVVVEATALVIQFTGNAHEVILYNGTKIVGRFPGPGSVNLALSRPIAFTKAQCSGTTGNCNIGWIGNLP
jgi:hypothetical protein